MRLADTPPAFCAACHCQQAQKRHVDFEAYYDGPVMDGLTHKQPIDDLVICEDCLSAAANLIGWVNNKQMRQENYELGKVIDERDLEIEDMRKVIADLEHTLGITLSGKIRRGAGRPKFTVPENLKELVEEKAA